MERLDALTGARFFAAASVLAFHLTGLGNLSTTLKVLGSCGRCGVCFFFILSGFVLTYNYHERFAEKVPRAYRKFLLARFARIGPTHVLVLLAITPLCLWLNSRGALLAAHSAPVISLPVATSAWFANLFLVQIYVPTPAFEKTYNAPAWSVACEVMFYLLFPFFISRLGRIGTTPLRLILIGAAIFLIETAIVFAFLFADRRWFGSVNDRHFDFFVSRMPFVRFGEFAVGCCAGLYFLSQQTATTRRPTGDQMLVIAVALFGITLAVFGCLPFFRYTTWFVAVTPAFAVLVIAIAMAPKLLTGTLENPVILLLGEASYALYMLHWIAVLVVRYQYDAAAPGWYLLTAGAICIAASVAFLIFIDVPIRRRLREHTSDRTSGVVVAQI